jgi:hypothetical protein
MIGGSLFYDFARVGATPAPFQSFVLSAGVVTDYVYGAGMHWQGGCGGFPCDGKRIARGNQCVDIAPEMLVPRAGSHENLGQRPPNPRSYTVHVIHAA